MSHSDTIFAPASGSGKAGICVIRISGSTSSFLLKSLAGTLSKPRFMTFCQLKHPETGLVLDQALIVWFSAPHSFTGEDMAELHIHGGLAVRQSVLSVLASFPGCRPAEPGEFARRAFLNHKMDLAQIEGLADLIDAETRAQHQQALRQMDGVLGRSLEHWREKLLQGSALCEALLDFSDEGDVASDLDSIILDQTYSVLEEARMLLAQGRRGERVREGFVVALMGPPNAGKSSLLNAFAQREAAIVSPYEGTTRDPIEIHCDFEGKKIIFIDTAGLRETADFVEQEGIKRALIKAQKADLVLWLQAANMLDEKAHPPSVSCPLWKLLSKSDLSPSNSVHDRFDHAFSSHNGEGLPSLKEAVTQLAEEEMSGDALLTRERHIQNITQLVQALEKVTPELVHSSPELAAEDIRSALTALGRMTGRVGVEDVLDRLFSSFCIGK
jgi:tRNA modification GTPase